MKSGSVKNFILVDNWVEPENEGVGNDILIFGKIDGDLFSIEFTHPLSPLQAFAIAVSQFDYKLNC